MNKHIPASKAVDECAEAVNMIENSTDELKYDQHTSTPAHLHTEHMSFFPHPELNQQLSDFYKQVADSLTDQSINENEEV